ncbi:hypothetical protein Osc7112_3586 [Oscillatoria nigro-viridis PCC 7112]|uniref:Uncharacterized protein n=1 Tax=Phormidium nigroviride PCC 7112 TaxID=179408 RepID=K9VL45_9CYAN|nr:hypothetical protein [Oscillatoria nigro-viridis]AFZ07950.1 hypothetical protein Osc7112_3586 [Oscillatoria nigro-viridis PCC 7112]
MGYFIAAIVLGMLIWAGFEIVQTIRNWETNPEETTSNIQAEMLKETYRGQFGADALEGGSQAVGNALHAGHCAAEAGTCEAAASAIAPIVEGLLHVGHH